LVEGEGVEGWGSGLRVKGLSLWPVLLHWKVCGHTTLPHHTTMMPPSLPLFAFLRATRREQLFIAVTFRRISLWKWHHEVDVDWGGITCLSFPTHDRHDLQLTLHRSARSGRRCTTTRSAVVRRGTYLATYGEDGVLWSPEGHYRSPLACLPLQRAPQSVNVDRYTSTGTHACPRYQNSFFLEIYMIVR